MAVRSVVLLLAVAASLVPGPAWAAADLPGFTIDAPGTATPDGGIDVTVAPADDRSLYVHPLDRLVGLFAVDDLDEDLRPRSGADYRIVELRPAGDGHLTGSVAAPVGEYALVPYPDVTGELSVDGAVPESALLRVTPPTPPAPSGRPVGLVLLGMLAVAVAIPMLVGRWIHRRREVDDYFERDFRDPPTLGGIWPGGGGGGGAAG